MQDIAYIIYKSWSLAAISFEVNIFKTNSVIFKSAVLQVKFFVAIAQTPPCVSPHSSYDVQNEYVHRTS